MGKKKILSIDDDKDICYILKEILESSGYEVTTCYDGVEGLTEALTTNPDLVITDMKMRPMDGLEFLRQLREYEEYKTLPVMMLSGEADKSDILEAIKYGLCDYIVKPFTRESLLKKINSFFHRHTHKKNIQPLINYKHFEACDLRVGVIKQIQQIDKAGKMYYSFDIDFGEIVGIKKSFILKEKEVANEQLLDKQVVCLLNLKPTTKSKTAIHILKCLDKNETTAMLLLDRPEIPSGTQIF